MVARLPLRHSNGCAHVDLYFALTSASLYRISAEHRFVDALDL